MGAARSLSPKRSLSDQAIERSRALSAHNPRPIQLVHHRDRSKACEARAVSCNTTVPLRHKLPYLPTPLTSFASGHSSGHPCTDPRVLVVSEHFYLCHRHGSHRLSSTGLLGRCAGCRCLPVAHGVCRLIREVGACCLSHSTSPSALHRLWSASSPFPV